MSIATWVVEEYKDFDDFVNDAIEDKKSVYFFNFDDCKKMVTEAYLTLDLSDISALREGVGEREEEEAREQVAEEAGTDEGVIEVPRPEMIATWVFKEVATTPKA